jgi:hypothetical protein
MALTKVTSGLISADASSVDLNIDAGTLYIDSTNNRVGVGTTSPVSVLDVAGTTPTLTIKDTQNKSWTSSDTTLGELAFRTSDTSGIGEHNVAFVRAVNEVVSSTTPSGALSFGISASNANASEAMRIDTSGNVVIGSGGLDVSGIGGTYTALNMRAGGGYPVLYGQTTATTTNSAAMQIVGATSGASAGGAAEMLGVIQIAAESDSSTNGTGYINFYTGSGGSVTERMRIDSSGFLQIATTGKTGRINLQPNPSNNHFVEFYTTADGKVGEINTTGGTTTNYVTSSDYRLKENVEYDWDATTRLKQLKPARFNFIADANTTVDGFLAHEVSSIVPEAIHGEKDAVDDEGNPKYQGIDQSKLVPLLVKTIQELEARITALENT